MCTFAAMQKVYDRLQRFPGGSCGNSNGGRGDAASNSCTLPQVLIGVVTVMIGIAGLFRPPNPGGVVQPGSGRGKGSETEMEMGRQEGLDEWRGR